MEVPVYISIYVPTKNICLFLKLISFPILFNNNIMFKNSLCKYCFQINKYYTWF